LGNDWTTNDVKMLNPYVKLKLPLLLQSSFLFLSGADIAAEVIGMNIPNPLHHSQNVS
jgi:hypothetical protein